MRHPLIVLLAASASCGLQAASNTPIQLTPGLVTVMRQTQQPIAIPAGGRESVTVFCQDGEVVLNGGPGNVPTGVNIALSTPAFDNGRSGWTVDYENNTLSSMTVSPRTTAICTKGSTSIGSGR